MPRLMTVIVVCLCSSLFAACTRDELCTTSDDSLTRALLKLSDEASTRLSANAPRADTMARLHTLCVEAQKAVGHSRGEAAVDRLNEFLFKKSGFRREVDDPDIRFMLLPYVVRHRQGSCLGLASLYVVLARALDMPIRPVLVPGHIFVRLAKKHSHVNIELFHQGEFMPDDWYRKKWRVPNHVSSYMRELTDEQFVSVLLFNLGNEYRTRGLLDQALEKYSAASEGFSDFAEAHASMGLVYQMQGKLQKAMDSYLRAKHIQPGLEGLDGNMRKLKRQPDFLQSPSVAD